MDLVAAVGLQILYGIANLALISLGLAIIFGMMRVINLAHGEFLMLGGYTVVVAANAGVNLWVAMLILAPLVVGVIGVVVERLLIRWLYGRMIDTLLATWGLSLLFIGIVTSIFGASTATTISPPLGVVSIGEYTSSAYELLLIGITVALGIAVFLVLKMTSLGLVARGTMQNAEMASALGVSTSRVYMITFGIGAAISGLAGGLLAPVTGVLPTIGAVYIAKAFITVISGGAAILAGTASASVLLGGVNGIAAFLTGPHHRRGRPARHRHRAPAPDAARDHRRPLPKEPVILARDVRGTLAIAAVGVLFMLIAPSVLELFTIINLTTAIALAVLALSLALVWGYGGILCFGQNAFFGIGAYAYTIAAINFGGSSWAILVAILVAVAFAVVIGYVMFYGRVSDVYLAVITLTVSLILYSLIRRTSGPDYKIGKSLLGGFNGITSPPINLPWDSSFVLFPEHVFYVAMGALVVAYLFTSWLTRTHFGRVCVSIRENELRAELLGYDVRLYKLGIFAVGAGIAGLAGVLFCNGVGRVTPDVFNLYNAALTIIWVIVGGRGTLIGPILGAFGLFYLTSALGTQSTVNNNLVLGSSSSCSCSGCRRG